MDSYSFAELADIAMQAESVMDTQFQYWITVTFAFVVAGFVAGERLSRSLRFSVAGLYLLATTLLTLRAWNSARTVDDITEYLAEEGAAVFFNLNAPMGPLRLTLVVAGAGLAVYFLIRRPGVRSSDADCE